jgi:putative membrane protein
LEKDGKKQLLYPKSTDGWLKTFFVLEGRALDRIIMPWILVTLNAVAWTLAAEMYDTDFRESNLAAFESIFGLILSSSLSFLLVFRLNRSAERFWMARMSWGAIIASSRVIVGGILVHAHHDPKHRDEVIRWTTAFSVVLTNFMRGIRKLDPGTVLGILGEAEIQELETMSHPPIQVAEKIRMNLAEAFHFDDKTPYSIAQGRSQRLETLEKEVNNLILEMGALERIQATPLPLVYVTHLRTFLVGFLLGFPYIWERNLGYGTIPVVALTGFAFLGLEGAAMEVESPFEKNRPNHLNMDAFCLVLLKNILQLIQNDADREILSQQRPDQRGSNVEQTVEVDPSI